MNEIIATTGTECERFFAENSGYVTAITKLCEDYIRDNKGKDLPLQSATHISALVHYATGLFFKYHPDRIHSMNDLAQTTHFQNFYEWLVAKLDRLTDYRSTPQVLTQLVWEAFVCAWHRHHHIIEKKKVYEVSVGIGELLLHTETSNITSEDIRLPYPSIYISLPAGVLSFADILDDSINIIGANPDVTYTKDNLPAAIEGVYLKETIEADGAHAWYILACGFPKIRNADLTALSLALRFMPGEKINKALAKSEANKGVGVKYLRLIKWLLNIVLYTTSANAELNPGFANKEYKNFTDRLTAAQGNKREKIKEQRRGLDPQARIYVGRSVRALEVREKLAALTAKIGAERAVILLKKIKVAGHYRRQPVGPKIIVTPDAPARCVEYNRIFIEPYWRNLNATEEQHRVHLLSDRGMTTPGDQPCSAPSATS